MKKRRVGMEITDTKITDTKITDMKITDTEITETTRKKSRCFTTLLPSSKFYQALFTRSKSF